MPTLLVINSSPDTKDSSSRKLVNAFAQKCVTSSAEYKVIERDIGVTPIPHLINESLDVISSKPTVSSAFKMRELSDTLITELKKADIVVFGVPMHNFSIPSTLKAYFDLVIRSGQTIDYTDDGTVGLIKGKKAFVITTGGGDHQDTPRDFQGPYLKYILNYIGINEVTFIRAHKLLWSDEDRSESMERAIKEIDRCVASISPSGKHKSDASVSAHEMPKAFSSSPTVKTLFKSTDMSASAMETQTPTATTDLEYTG